MRLAQLRRLPVLFVLTLPFACGDDEKATPTNVTADGGPIDPGAPGLTAKDCPGTPTSLNLVKVAPFWQGLVALELTVPGGIPDGIDAQVLDPASGDYRPNFSGGLRQKPDGRYVMVIGVSAREAARALEHKIRVRSRLQGCPLSAWAESPGFTLSDPIGGTTWKAEFPTGSMQANLYVNVTGAGSATGPYDIDGAPATHTISFAADGTLSETYGFAVRSRNPTPGDLYNNCTFNLSFVGTWRLQVLGESTTLLLSTRRPKAGAASTGSTCAAPALAEMRINQGDTDFEIPAQTQYFGGIDYTPLLDSTPGKPVWQSNLASGFNNVLQAISDTEGTDTANVNGSAYPQISVHVRQ